MKKTSLRATSQNGEAAVTQPHFALQSTPYSLHKIDHLTTIISTTRKPISCLTSPASQNTLFLLSVLLLSLCICISSLGFGVATAEQQTQQLYNTNTEGGDLPPILLTEVGLNYDHITHLGVPAPPLSTATSSSSSDELPLVNIYRYEVKKTVSFEDFSSMTELVKLAQTQFEDMRITRLLSLSGTPIASLPRLVKLAKNGEKELSVLALGKEERFMWPALKVGDEVELEVGGRMVTVRTLALQPRLFEIDNLIDHGECDHIVERAKQLGLRRSKVGDEADSATLDTSRTSSQLWVGPLQHNDDEIFERVRQRVYNLTRLPNDLGEDTQVVHYSKDQHYYAHHDFTRKKFVLDNPYYVAGGNRLVTVLYYLNDVEVGGETGFPYVNSHTNPKTGITGECPSVSFSVFVWWLIYHHLTDYSKACDYGLKLKPKKGGAAMFYSLAEDGHMDGKVDMWSLHAGCDVHKGEKWLANQWIRNKRVDGKLFGAHY
jgi:hypothetical protein